MRYTQLIRGGTLAVVMALLLMPLTVSAQTLERIKTSGTFNIGFVPDQPPFSSKGRRPVSPPATPSSCARRWPTQPRTSRACPA